LYLTLLGYEVGTTGFGLHKDHLQALLQIIDIGTLLIKEAFGKIDDIMSVKYYDKKGKHSDTMEKFYIYQETKDNNQLIDKHTIIYNKIFETIIEKEMNAD
jgi:hypothetical protein